LGGEDPAGLLQGRLWGEVREALLDEQRRQGPSALQGGEQRLRAFACENGLY
jgi:hypothetical protein